MNASTITSPVTAKAIAPLQILLLEPCTADAQNILHELHAAGFVVEPTLVSNRTEFVTAVSSGEFSAVLSAYQLSDWDGMRALQEVRRSGKDIPFILVTGVLGEDSAAECVKRGADDCVLKRQLARLPGALRRALAERHSRAQQQPEGQTESTCTSDPFIQDSLYGIFRVSPDGGFLSANPALLQMLAYPSLQVLQGFKLVDAFRYPEHHVKLLASFPQNGTLRTVETEWRRRDGGFVAVKLHFRCVTVPGTPMQLEGMVEDLTELRALEHQLRQAQKYEAIGELARGVAHDFNNVIGAILGWAELGFEENQQQPQIADRFSRIRAQASRAATLTRELLAIGRRQTLQRQSTDLNSILQNLTMFLSRVIPSDIQIDMNTRELRPVHADSSQIEHVLINLCLNARDAMPHGGRLLVDSELAQLDDSYCRFHHGVLPGLYSVVSVSDTGAGMAPEIRDRIFEPFFTTKQGGTGTGMGLATAYGIVKQHGGFIHVYSEPGHGSLFRVYLPAIEEESTSRQSAEAAPDTKAGGTETLLLAEDHDSIREMTRQSLASLGYRVLSAANGEDALRLCEQEAPALAILDMVMPHMGGAETAVQLRSRFPQIPILFASGYSEAQECTPVRLPNSSYLQKPYSPTALARAVRKFLDPRGDS
jgi:signal transduction histidine kinase